MNLERRLKKIEDAFDKQAKQPNKLHIFNCGVCNKKFASGPIIPVIPVCDDCFKKIVKLESRK